jgi:histone arginine demethylase JMJD6
MDLENARMDVDAHMEIEKHEESTKASVKNEHRTKSSNKIIEVDKEKEDHSSECSSSFSLSDEETEEEKKVYKDHCQQMIKKFGLDEDHKHFPKGNKMSSRVKYYTFDAKRKQREEIGLKGWHKLRLYKEDSFLDDWINEPDEVSTINVDRVHIDDLTVEDFMERYEKPSIPCILVGCSENWDAMSKWNFPDLIKKFKRCKLKVGEDDEGYPLKLKLKYFIEYLIFNKDDSPLYLFQSGIESRKKIKEIVKDYSVPKYFQDDYFKILGADNRPPHRWLLMGPKRSGSTIHIDPLSTSAWNTSVQGHKRWVLFPPSCTKEFVKGKKYKQKGDDDEAIHYMRYMYPQIIKNENVEKKHEFIQRPGETVYVPGKWWHCVLNLDDTIAITQNYCNRGNFDRVWRDARKNRKRMAVKWLRKMKTVDNQLYKRAIEINKEDKFLMYDH